MEDDCCTPLAAFPRATEPKTRTSRAPRAAKKTTMRERWLRTISAGRGAALRQPPVSDRIGLGGSISPRSAPIHSPP
jgi:hypothetical protein